MSHHEVAVGQHEIDFARASGPFCGQRDHLQVHGQGIAPSTGCSRPSCPSPFSGSTAAHARPPEPDRCQNGRKSSLTRMASSSSQRSRAISSPGSLPMRALCRHRRADRQQLQRLTPGYEAPVYVCWAQRNRSAMIRVPRYPRPRAEHPRRAALPGSKLQPVSRVRRHARSRA